MAALQNQSNSENLGKTMDQLPPFKDCSWWNESCTATAMNRSPVPSSGVLGANCVLEFKAFLNIIKSVQYTCHLSKHSRKCLQQRPPPPQIIHFSVSAVNLWKHKWPHFNYSQVCFWVFLCILSSVHKTLWHCTIQLLQRRQSYE